MRFDGGGPIGDKMRVRNLAASPGGLTTTRGVITKVWHIVSKNRDLANKTSITYKTAIDEGFDVGTERFAWRPGSCLSNASLCDFSQGRERLVEGMTVEVRWFEDSAMENAHRVVQLRSLPYTMTEPVNQEVAR